MVKVPLGFESFRGIHVDSVSRVTLNLWKKIKRKAPVAKPCTRSTNAELPPPLLPTSRPVVSY